MDKENLTVDDLIASVGIPISKDDPVYIQFALMNHQMSEWVKKQDELLEQFENGLMSCKLSWDHEAQMKAERVMNFALKTGREQLEETALTCMQYLHIRKMEAEKAELKFSSNRLLVPLAVGLMVQIASFALLLLWLR